MGTPGLPLVGGLEHCVQTTQKIGRPKGSFKKFQVHYIGLVQSIVTYLTSAQRDAHDLKIEEDRPNTLITIDPNTRPPPIYWGKELLGHLCQT